MPLLALLLQTTLALAREAPVQVRPVDLRSVQIGLGGASFDLVLEAERTRGLPLRLRSLDYRVEVNGRTITTAQQDLGGLRLRKGEPAQVVLPVRLSGLDAVAAIADTIQKRDLAVRLTGEARVRVCLIPARVQIDEELTRR
jgi:hypothetical protein